MAIASCGSSAETSVSPARSSWRNRALPSIVTLASRARTLRSCVTISGFTSISVASSSVATSCSSISRSGCLLADVFGDPGVGDDRTGVLGAEGGARVDVALDHGGGVGLGDLLDVHPALGGDDRQQLLLGAVEDDRRVVLGGDLRSLLDPELVDGEAADVHPQDRLGVGAQLRLVAGDLDPSGLSPLADRDLGLDHAGVADSLAAATASSDAGRVATVGDRHAVLGEQPLSLVFEQVHIRPRQPIRAARRGLPSAHPAKSPRRAPLP